MSDSPAFRVLSDVVARLERLGIPYALGGSTASGVWGQPRYTNDLDIGIDLSHEQRVEFVEAFSPEYLISESELSLALQSKEAYRMVQALHLEEVFKIDFFLVGDDAFGQSVLQRARTVKLADGVSCRIQSAEDVLIHKLRW